jgi:hypothetical protein
VGARRRIGASVEARDGRARLFVRVRIRVHLGIRGIRNACKVNPRKTSGVICMEIGKYGNTKMSITSVHTYSFAWMQS